MLYTTIVWYSNVFGIRMFGIQALSAHSHISFLGHYGAFAENERKL